MIPINSDGNLHNQLYTSTAFDMRHRFTVSGTYAIPGNQFSGQVPRRLVNHLRGYN